MAKRNKDRTYKTLNQGEGLCGNCCLGMMEDLLSVGFLEFKEQPDGHKILQFTDRALQEWREGQFAKAA